jgi:hypothetical protein
MSDHNGAAPDAGNPPRPPRHRNVVALAVLQRRHEAVKLYLMGWPQWKIAEKFGVQQPAISKDLAALRKEWRASALLNFHERQIEELAKIDLTEAEAWAAWQ